MSDAPGVRPAPGGAFVPVRIQPRSSRRGVAGLRDGHLLLRVNAPPVEGRANDEARDLLAAATGVPRRRISLVSGARSRRKVFLVGGIEAAALAEIVRRAADGAGRGKKAGKKA